MENEQEKVYMNPHFRTQRDKDQFFRLLENLPEDELKDACHKGIYKLFFDLGQGIPVFVEE